jgi:hypothetical protein
MALSLSVLMAGAWMVQQHNGNSGWVDTIWTFAVGLVGVGGALWPVAGAAPHARQWLVAVLVAIWSVRLGLHIAVRTAGITDDPRYAASRANGASIRRAGCSCFCKTRDSDRSRWCLRFSWRPGFRQYADLFEVEKEWRWSGTHYQRTALDWLANFDSSRDEIDGIFRGVYGSDTSLWMRRWCWFFLATSGLFGYADGIEWGVSHFRMKVAA